MFNVLKMTLKNLDMDFYKVKAIKLTLTKQIFVYLLWRLCHLLKSSLYVYCCAKFAGHLFLTIYINASNL